MIKKLTEQFKLPVLAGAMLLAIIATVYILGAATPQEAHASSHVQEVPLDWPLTPSGIRAGDRFRLIFLSSDKRTASSTNMTDYNNWIIARAAAGHVDIREYGANFKAVGCTAVVDTRDNTSTTYTNSDKGVPIYWLNGNKVADHYEDFYDENWDDEVNDKDEHGNNGPNTSQEANYPFTGCDHDGTEGFTDMGVSRSLGSTDDKTRVARPDSTETSAGPLGSDYFAVSTANRPMYGLSQVFKAQALPSNTGTLTTGGTARQDWLDASDDGDYWRAKLHKGVKYRIDVKGSESSQYGGTLTNPWIKVLAGSTRLKVLNDSAPGVSQTTSETEATLGGAGQNSRLDIKVIANHEEPKYYYLLVYRDAEDGDYGEGDHGSYTITANRLDWPTGRLAPDITVTTESRTGFIFTWAEPAKTQDTLVAPLSGYKVQYRTRPGGNWSAETTKNANQRSHEITGLTAGQKYQVRVRAYHPNPHPNTTYRWGYATIYTDDCAGTGANACNGYKPGRINYDASGDVDGYTVRLTGGQTYIIRVNAKSNKAGTLVDPKLALRRISTNNLVGTNDNGGTGLDSKITYTPPATNDYLILVSAVQPDDRGTYKVKVKQR